MSYMEFLDGDNPIGVLSLTTGRVRQAIAALPEELVLMEEIELRRLVKPTNTDYCLRTAFWREYELVVKKDGSCIKAASFLKGVCSDAYFYQKFLNDERRVAWLVRPLQNYQAEIEAVLVKGTDRLWEIMEMDLHIIDRRGDRVVCPKKAGVVLEAIKMVEARAKGHALMRSEGKTLVGHVVPPNPLIAVNDPRILHERMASLSQKIHGADIVKVEADAED